MSKEFGNKPHKGIRTFTGPEASNVLIGQSGFDILLGTTAGAGTEFVAGEGDYTDVRMWVALKAIDSADAEICLAVAVSVE